MLRIPPTGPIIIPSAVSTQAAKELHMNLSPHLYANDKHGKSRAGFKGAPADVRSALWKSETCRSQDVDGAPVVRTVAHCKQLEAPLRKLL